MGLTGIDEGCIIYSDEVEKSHFFYSSNPKYATIMRVLRMEEECL